MISTSRQLVLGTAQLGIPYGIANRVGVPDIEGSVSIINEAWENGIREFDTAQGYGEIELTLGKAIADLGLASEIRITSKFDPRLDHQNIRSLSESLDRSLNNLGIESLHGMLLHKEELLNLWHNGLSYNLFKLVESGKIRKLGVSVYSIAGAIEALNTEGIDMVQLPTNILDRRFENAGVFELAKQKGKIIYIRSIFLQGLLLLDAIETPDHLSIARPVLDRLGQFADEFGLTKKDIAIGYIKREMPQAYIIFGAETQDQIRENALIWRNDLSEDVCKMVREIFVDVDEQILNPTKWIS